MANVINRITRQYLKSVNTPDYMDGNWIINPILPECDPSEWVIEGDVVRETTQEEKNIKIAEKLAEEEVKEAKELSDKNKADAKVAKDREDFMNLSLKDKVVYLYDRI